MDGRKAKIKILKSKNNRNLKDDVLEANIKYIDSTSDHTSSITTNKKTTKKRKTTTEIVTEVINKTVPVMISNALKPIEASLKTVVAIQEEQGRELKSTLRDFNTIVRVNNLKTK